MVLKGKIEQKIDVIVDVILSQNTPLSIKQTLSHIFYLMLGFFVLGLFLLFYIPGGSMFCAIIVVGLIARICRIAHIVANDEYYTIVGCVKQVSRGLISRIIGIELRPSERILLETSEGDVELALNHTRTFHRGYIYEFSFSEGNGRSLSRFNHSTRSQLLGIKQIGIKQKGKNKEGSAEK